MDEKLKATIEKIRQLAISNPEFDKEMRKMFGKQKSSAITISGLPKIQDDVTVIREVMEIRGNLSVDYSFIDNKYLRLRNQLEIDNYRMENASLSISQDEDHRFYVFCVNAFYQVENIINFYYHISFPKIEELIEEIELFTEAEIKQFSRRGDEKNVSNIDVIHKINAFCNRWLPNSDFKKQLSFLRIVRNNGEHRCSAIIKNKQVEDNENIRKFWTQNTFNDVRIILKNLVETIKTLLVANIEQEVKNTELDIQKNNCIYKDAIIKTLLNGYCKVEYDSKTERIPDKLLSKINGKKTGETITIEIDSKGKVKNIII